MKIHHISLVLLLGIAIGRGSEPSRDTPRFLGPASCSSTSCHGGASPRSNQNLIWSKRDFHSRSYATLTSARSERFAEVLQLGDATTSPRCTVCHAPFQTVPELNRLPDAKPIRGVSCESCHAPAENWLRSHTRPDFSHDDRVSTGMRDLKSLYVRANTCVACHQTLDQDIARAGHPELTFELDGQCASEPRHWTERSENVGPQAWLVGQAVALRELSWQLSRETSSDENLTARWEGLWWMLQKISDITPTSADSIKLPSETGHKRYASAKNWSDTFAKKVSTMMWTEELTKQCLKKLSAVAADFEDAKLSKKVQARRAERLALAYDRLTVHSTPAGDTGSEQIISEIFRSVQSLPDFDSRRFAGLVRKFSMTDKVGK